MKAEEPQDLQNGEEGVYKPITWLRVLSMIFVVFVIAVGFGLGYGLAHPLADWNMDMEARKMEARSKAAKRLFSLTELPDGGYRVQLQEERRENYNGQKMFTVWLVLYPWHGDERVAGLTDLYPVTYINADRDILGGQRIDFIWINTVPPDGNSDKGHVSIEVGDKVYRGTLPEVPTTSGEQVSPSSTVPLSSALGGVYEVKAQAVENSGLVTLVARHQALKGNLMIGLEDESIVEALRMGRKLTKVMVGTEVGGGTRFEFADGGFSFIWDPPLHLRAP